MTSSNYWPEKFDVADLDEAVRIILTPEDGTSPKERWEKETPPMADLFESLFDLGPDSVVLDYGCGIGRLSRELIERTGCGVVGVDISRSMRALSHIYTKSENFFSCSREWLRVLSSAGFRVDHACSVWVLQHCENPEEDIELIFHILAEGGTFCVVNLNTRCLPTSNGWEDDGIDVETILKERFKLVENPSLPENAVTDAARPMSFCGLYRKPSGER